MLQTSAAVADNLRVVYEVNYDQVTWVTPTSRVPAAANGAAHVQTVTLLVATARLLYSGIELG